MQHENYDKKCRIRCVLQLAACKCSEQGQICDEHFSRLKVVNTKLVKKLVDTDFYELRISVGNEYRVILFTIDHENFIEAEQILLLNGFMKKSTKDYKKEIQKAEQILNSLQQ